MKRKYTKFKALSSCFSGKSIASYLWGTRFKPCLSLVPLCMHSNISRPWFYLHYICICLILYLRFSFSSYFQHANVHVWPSPLSHCTFSILSVPHNFHTIAENLHENMFQNTRLLARLHTSLLHRSRFRAQHALWNPHSLSRWYLLLS